MKNILSYPVGTLFRGREIKEWIDYHMNHETSHTREAKHLQRYLSCQDDEIYVFKRGTYNSSASYNKPVFECFRRLDFSTQN